VIAEEVGGSCRHAPGFCSQRGEGRPLLNYAVLGASATIGRARQGPTDYPGLLWTIVRTDFKARYHGTLGGFLWALLKPAAMFVVLFGVFSFIFASDPDYRLNLLIGLFLWDFFAESTKVGLLSLHAKGFLLSKSRFPRWIMVATSSSNALITLSVFSVALFVLLAASHRMPGPVAWMLYAFYLLHLYLMALGISLAASVLFLRYRDLNQVWEVVTQAGFFLAPIVYPIDILPERFHRLLYIWPPTPVIQDVRAVLVAGAIPSLRAHLLLTLLTFSILFLGMAVYRRHAPRAAEYL
jgi:ABC-2 type transport system permease protein